MKNRVLSTLLAAALLLALLLPIAPRSLAAAASGDCGAEGSNLKWSFDTASGTLTITGAGAMADFPYNDAPWETYKRDKIKTVRLPAGLTTVGNYAFSNCEQLTELALPDGLRSIGSSAFYYCRSLATLTIPKTVTQVGYSALSFCSLTEVGIPDGVTKLESFTFSMCSDLKTVTIGSGLAEIDRYAFYGCTALLRFDVDPDNAAFCSDGGVLFSKDRGTLLTYPAGLAGAYGIPGSVTRIADWAFCGCAGLTAVTIPDSVTGIGSSAFADCTALKEAVIPDSVTGIGDEAFQGCTSLASLKLSSGLKDLGYRAFNGCAALTEVTIPDSLTVIKTNTFFNCTGLTSVTLGKSLRMIYPAFFESTKLASVTIPASVDFLHLQAFPEQTELIFERGTAGTGVFAERSELSVPVSTWNTGENFYSTWASPVESYLYEQDGFYYRAEYEFDKIWIEKYTKDFRFVESVTVPLELQFFGGFYAGEDGFYLVFGGKNPDQDENREVFRIVKYSLDWERIADCRLCGMNTVEAFKAGSLRMTEDDRFLYIRTCHLMYKYTDGCSHQANMTLILDKEHMVCREGVWQIRSTTYGYVSHSFNQFIRADGDEIFALDHGDAYPRSVVLFVYDTSDDEEIDLPKKNCEVFAISGTSGDNRTGVSVGGFELSPQSCLIAFNSIDQKNFDAGETKNVWLSVVNRETMQVRNTQLTSYAENGELQGMTPQLVKISDELFAVMWEESGTQTGPESDALIRIAFTDGAGTLLGEPQSVRGKVSDCQPVLLDGRVTWYVTDNKQINFYSFRAEQTSGAVRVADYRIVTLDTKDDPDLHRDPCEGYRDVDRSAWYHSAVDFVIRYGYMGSTSTTDKLFEPNTKVSRAMVASILYRICGSPDCDCDAGTFTDVSEGRWYATAVEWCAQNGLASGKGNGCFDPDGSVTRQELAVFMYKLAEYRGEDTSDAASLRPYPDAGTVPGWAKPYLEWAVGSGLISGKGQSNGTTLLAPTATAMRCELASILQRFLVPFPLNPVG